MVLDLRYQTIYNIRAANTGKEKTHKQTPYIVFDEIFKITL
jgi:hypothetical protein